MRFALLLFIATLGFAGEFTTSVGGAYQGSVVAITTDAAGNTYAVGTRELSVTSADIFVTKLDPNGNVLFTDTFAGKGTDTPLAIAVDPTGNIYFAGNTTSPDFPLSKALQTQPSGYVTGFITKLSADGSAMLYSTYFGGTLGKSSISALATDAKGNLYLTGYTQSSDFPHTVGMPFGNVTQNPYSPGVILASISAAGDKILYSGAIAGGTPCAALNDPTCISNGPNWEGVGIGLDAAGYAYVAGNFNSTGLPTTPGVLSPTGVGAFITKVDAGGTGIGYLTYLGSGQVGYPPLESADYFLNGIAVDAAGNAYLTGSTDDPNFPVSAGAYETTQGASRTAFVAKLNPTGSAILWATYLGGAPQSIAIDATGDVWVNGLTQYSVFPNTNGWSTGPEFVVGLNATGSKLIYSALYPTGTVAQALAVDPLGLVHVAGSAGFILAINPNGAPTMQIFGFQNAFGGNITARISPGEVIAIYGPQIGPATAVSGAPVNGFFPTSLGGVEVSVNGVKAPLLYVSATQINAVVPMELPVAAASMVQVTNGTALSSQYPVWGLASAPLANPAVLNQDGSLNSQANPAHGGSYVTFYGTGWQSNFAPLADGQVATVANDVCLGQCTASVTSSTPPQCVGFCGLALPFGASIPATVQYAGAAPGLVAGATQFNVQLGAVPASSGVSPMNLSVTGAGPTLANGSVGVYLWIEP